VLEEDDEDDDDDDDDESHPPSTSGPQISRLSTMILLFFIFIF